MCLDYLNNPLQNITKKNMFSIKHQTTKTFLLKPPNNVLVIMQNKTNINNSNLILSINQITKQFNGTIKKKEFSKIRKTIFILQQNKKWKSILEFILGSF